MKGKTQQQIAEPDENIESLTASCTGGYTKVTAGHDEAHSTQLREKPRGHWSTYNTCVSYNIAQMKDLGSPHREIENPVVTNYMSMYHQIANNEKTKQKQFDKKRAKHVKKYRAGWKSLTARGR